jgi:hypothetical protein
MTVSTYIIFALLRSIKSSAATRNPATPRIGFIHAREKRPAKSTRRTRNKSVRSKSSLGRKGMIKNATRRPTRMDE